MPFLTVEYISVGPFLIACSIIFKACAHFQQCFKVLIIKSSTESFNLRNIFHCTKREKIEKNSAMETNITITIAKKKKKKILQLQPFWERYMKTLLICYNNVSGDPN